MSVHLQREIERLKRAILSLSALVEENVGVAVRALLDRDKELAERLIRLDQQVDQREVDVEEECLKILALHQPVAIDLRFIVSSLKINNDLERIGDLAVSISNKALFLIARPFVEIPFDLAGMAQNAQTMLHDSLEAFVNVDVKRAAQVCAMDDKVDAEKKAMRRQIEDLVRSNVARFDVYYALMGVVRNLERIADHATNIAEDVIYMVEGKIVRHGPHSASAT